MRLIRSGEDIVMGRSISQLFAGLSVVAAMGCLPTLPEHESESDDVVYMRGAAGSGSDRATILRAVGPTAEETCAPTEDGDRLCCSAGPYAEICTRIAPEKLQQGWVR